MGRRVIRSGDAAEGLPAGGSRHALADPPPGARRRDAHPRLRPADLARRRHDQGVQRPDYSSETIGGVQYSVAGSNEIDPSSSADARFVKGMPGRRAPRPEGRQCSSACSSHGPIRQTPRCPARRGSICSTGSAARTGRFASPPRTRTPTRRARSRRAASFPRRARAAADDIAASGQLLLYRVPAQQVANGWLELAVHDPLHRGVVDTSNCEQGARP